MEERVGIGLCGGDVDIPVIVVQVEPGLALGEASLGAVRPLDGRAGGVSRGCPQALQPLLRGSLRRLVEVLPAGLHVLVHLRIGGVPVGHADFLTLIYEGRALLEQIRRGQSLAAQDAVFFAAVAGYDTGMVMVFQIKHVPCLPLQPLLPLRPGSLEPAQRKGRVDVVAGDAIGAHALELDDHVDDLAGLFLDVFQRLLHVHHGSLSQGHAVVIRERAVVELGQVLQQVRAVVVLEKAAGRGHQPVVGQTLGLGDEGDHVLAEAVYALVQPEAEDFLHFLPHEGVVHVQVRLLDSEEVQVVFAAQLVILPGLALEKTVPVVGQSAVRARGPPDVIVRVGLDAATALLEPLMLTAGVVHHQIHDHLDVPGVRALQHLFKGLHAAVFRGYVHIIRDIVAAVHPRRGIQRREPDPADAERFDVIQLFIDAPEVAHAVAVAVFEAARPDLIKDPVLVPLRVFHGYSSFFGRSLQFVQKLYHTGALQSSPNRLLRPKS